MFNESDLHYLLNHAGAVWSKISELHYWADAIWSRIAKPEMILLWSTIIFAAIFTYWIESPVRRTMSGFIRYCFPPGLFSHPSTRADFLYWISLRITYPLCIAPVVLFVTTHAARADHELLVKIFGPVPTPEPASYGTLCLFTVTMVLAYDLSYYLYHLAAHKIPLLWEFHKVHHSAEVMVGTTKDRIHPIDNILNVLWDGVIPGFTYGAWMFFAMDPVEVTIYGLNVYVLRHIIFSDVVRHLHFRLSFGRWINYIILCPYYHQLHHSSAPQHIDKNFGLAFAIWDRMFGTLAVPKPNERFSFGLTNNEHKEYQSLIKLYILPFKKVFMYLYRMFRRPYRARISL